MLSLYGQFELYSHTLLSQNKAALSSRVFLPSVISQTNCEILFFRSLSVVCDAGRSEKHGGMMVINTKVLTSDSWLFLLFLYLCLSCQIARAFWLAVEWDGIHCKDKEGFVWKNWQHIVNGWMCCFSVCPVSLVTSTGLFSLLNDQQWFWDIQGTPVLMGSANTSCSKENDYSFLTVWRQASIIRTHWFARPAKTTSFKKHFVCQCFIIKELKSPSHCLHCSLLWRFDHWTS